MAADIIEINRETAVKIMDFLKEELLNLDLQLDRNKASNVGEMAANIIRHKKTNLRAIYDELKAAGVEGYDSTVELFNQSLSPTRK